jgi:hypothetical protein
MPFDEKQFESIVAEIKAEKEYAENLWGTEFDDKNTANDWASYLMIYAGRAVEMDRTTRLFNPIRFRTDMLKVAGLAISAIQTLDRNGIAKRHYDK